MIRRWFSFLEVRTKITSMFALMFALSYLFLNQITIRWGRTAVFLISMLAIDLMATALNNIKGAKSEKETLPISRKAALATVCLLALIGIGAGLLLVKLTGPLVLVVGALCFLFALLYSAGPIPISHTPFGEIASGLFYGLAIPFLVLLINYPPRTFVTTVLETNSVVLHIQVSRFVDLIVLTMIPVLLTANIMLANNICDCDKDRSVGRHTLAGYLGKEKALKLWKWLHYSVYGAALLAVAVGTVPWPYALLLLTWNRVQKEMATFVAAPSKNRTFPVSIRLYIGQMTAVIALMFLCGLAERWLI